MRILEIILTKQKKLFLSHLNLIGERIITVENNCEGKLHHWDDNYFNLYKVADSNDAFSETKISNPIFDRIFY